MYSNIITLVLSVITGLLILYLIVSILDRASGSIDDTMEDYNIGPTREEYLRKYDTSLLIEEILQEYEQLGIKLPLDILEELEFYNFKDRDEAINFIENQRIHWKYENMKKYRKNLFK